MVKQTHCKTCFSDLENNEAEKNKTFSMLRNIKNALVDDFTIRLFFDFCN